MKNELSDFFEQCSEVETTISELEYEISKQFLRMLEDADEVKSKKQACYDITNFIQFTFFSDELQKVISIAGGLELPDKHVQGDFNKRFNELKSKLREIIK